MTQASTNEWRKNRTNTQKAPKTKYPFDESKTSSSKVFINTERYLNGICSKIMDKQKFMKNMMINFNIKSDESSKSKDCSQNIEDKIAEKNVPSLDESIKDVETDSQKRISVDKVRDVTWMLSSYEKLVPLTTRQFTRTNDEYSFQGENEVMWVYKNSDNSLYPKVIKFSEIVDQKIYSAEKEPSKHVQELTDLLHKSFKVSFTEK